LKNHDGIKKVLDFAENGMRYDGERRSASGVTRGPLKYREVGTYLLRTVEEGLHERTIMEVKMDRFQREHPTQKPERLMERIIALVSDEGAVILDPFMGSGTTGAACVNTGRKFIGIELDGKYFDTACHRVDEARKQGRLHFG
jgi:site-specific DNA-methyltransferase (adenine-specific)